MWPALRLAFRVDATAAIGWGHLKRCMALGAALQEQGAVIDFCGRADAQAVPDLLAERGWTWRPLTGPDDAADPEQDVSDTLIALGRRPDLVVVDHYRLDARWHAAMRQRTSSRIVVIDDLANRPLAADLLIDHNPASDHRAKYCAVLTPAAPICGGPHYALLDSVYAGRPPVAVQAQVRRIGIFLGGTDPAGHTAWVLQVLRQQANWAGTVHLATTSANPRWQALQQAARDDGQVEFHCDLPHLADFHAGHDLQIGAGGGSLWERCCLGLPTIALACADNQRLSVPLLNAAGVVCGLEAVDKTAGQATMLAQAITRLVQHPEVRTALQLRSLELVDGNGAQRCASEILHRLFA
jgi:UDP-2,4-diacetamido-2,4,6-trideoxy-beta-L-altropyranose hydrolase